MASIHILLVEDEKPKQTHIQRFLDQVATDVTVSVARSVNTALDCLEEKPSDLLLLDMSLPTFDVGERESGGRPQGFGGIEILRLMTHAGIACPTIVITGYEAFTQKSGQRVELAQMREELIREFPKIFRGVLHYNSTYDEWERELAKTLQELGIVIGEVR